MVLTLVPNAVIAWTTLETPVASEITVADDGARCCGLRQRARRWPR